jgi:hypothetical protein
MPGTREARDGRKKHREKGDGQAERPKEKSPGSAGLCELTGEEAEFRQ